MTIFSIIKIKDCPDGPGTAEDAPVAAMISRGLPPDPEVHVVAARDIEGFGALRAVETGGNRVVAVLPDRGQITCWPLAVPLDQAGALGRFVAEADAKIDDPEPPESDEHNMSVLGEVRIGPGEVPRAMFVDADKPDKAGLALWRVQAPVVATLH